GAVHGRGHGGHAGHLAHVLIEVAAGDASVDGDLALVRVLALHDHAEEGVLPGAVGAYEANLLAPVELGGGFHEEDLLAVLLADVVEPNHRCTEGERRGLPITSQGSRG